jgi:hypothetical protein
MNDPLSLSSFESAWTTASTEITPASERKARNEVIRWYAGMTIEWSFAVVALGWATWTAVISRTALMTHLAVAIWVFVSFAIGFGTWNRRGLRTLASAPTHRFIEFQIRRRTAVRREVRFGLGLLAVELAFLIGWRTLNGLNESLPMDALKVSTVIAIFVWLLWLEIRAKRELLQLELLRQQLDLS